MNTLIENTKEGQEYPIYYAAFSKDIENVKNSSSGGIFYELCKIITAQGGIVYGAVQKNVMEVVHERADTWKDVAKFRCSKYLRSRIGACYENVQLDLENNKLVLFSGTPCQIAGLYNYLGQNVENLYTVEVVCHGVPLKDAYQKYVEEKNAVHGAKMCNINFRDKRYGWKENAICEIFEDGKEEVCQSTIHPHHSLYLKGINVESGCGVCRYAKIPRIADITLADFWQYSGKLLAKNKNIGLSLVCVNNKKGEKLFLKAKENLYMEKVQQKEALRSCKHMNHAPFVHFNQESFQKLIKVTSFHRAKELCTNFGEVVSASKLYLIQKEDVNEVFNALMEDSHEVVYLLDTQDCLKGIATFGAFVESYIKGKVWINYEFQRVSLYEADCITKIQHIFAENKKINRIPIIDERGRLLFEVRRTFGVNGMDDPRRFILPFIRSARESREIFFYKRPDLLSDFTYSEREKIRIENKYSFPVLCKDIDKNRDELRNILKKRYSKTYVEKLCEISPIIREGNYYRHKDNCSELINVIDGIRRTCYQPQEYSFTIHIYGRCGVFGYAVEDAETMPSRLQKIVSEKGIRVVSHSTWGAEDICIIRNLNEDLSHGVIKQQDIIILYMNYLPCMEELLQVGIYVKDTTQAFHEALGHGDIDFYDIPGHMNAEGYDFIAKYIYKDIKNKLQVRKIRTDESIHGSSTEKQEYFEFKHKEAIKEYIENIRKKIPIHDLQKKNVGTIVANCNPFTKGHRFLIETAASKVNVLLVFVVEEDKSQFPFSDRIEMVKLGTRDIENVFVFASGRYIISSYTWPEYFFKEQQGAVVIDTSKDVGIFARYIAPAFNIKTRFVGTEPIDKVTSIYNQMLKESLPQYGIKLEEIERLQNTEGYISAKKVRQFINEGKIMCLEEFLPESTLSYLKKKNFV